MSVHLKHRKKYIVHVEIHEVITNPGELEKVRFVCGANNTLSVETLEIAQGRGGSMARQMFSAALHGLKLHLEGPLEADAGVMP